MSDGPLVRTLVVDDDPVACRLHAGYVADIPGFTVVATVGTGSAALSVIGHAGVDLMLLDIRLPEFSGIEVLHRLRTLGGRPVDVIVISSSRDRVTVRQALSAQVVGYLVKPFGRAALTAKLEQYRDERSSEATANQDSFGQQEIDSLFNRRAGAHSGETATPGRGASSPGQDGPGHGASGLGASSPQSARPSVERLGRLPKGLSPATMELVLATLDGTSAVTAQEVAVASGASRATVRRYLEHLHSMGVVDVSHRYGRRGRPELLYRLAPPA